jgi:radical SAM protein with 4Fe4S-binding SPASM domain
MELPRLSAPVSFYLELTPVCNNRCPGCGNAFVEPGKRAVQPCKAPLPADGWQEILGQLGPYARRLKLTGGEPTLHPEFEAIVHNIADTNIPFMLFSNGRWAEPQRLVEFLGALPQFEGFLISLHGPNATSHEAFTATPGSFEQALVGVRTAVQGGLPVSLSCVLTRYNWPLVKIMADLARELGAASLVFNRYIGPDAARLAPSPEALRVAIQQIVALRAAGRPVKLGNCLPTCFEATDQAGCLAGLAFFTVDPWGEVRPCNHASLNCGNLKEHSVAEIWRSPAMEQWRRIQPEACQGCPALSTCRGGCRAEALFRGSDPLITAPLVPAESTPGQTVLLYGEARPVGRFERQAEVFGTLLMAGNRLYPVPRRDERILSMLDGQSTLRQIEARWGTTAVELVVSLYQNGMVDLKN